MKHIFNSTLILFALLASTCSSEVNKEGIPEAQIGAPQNINLQTEGLQGKEIDSQKSRFEFVGAKITDDHLGGFKNWQGTVYFKDQKPMAVKITIEADSIFADKEKLTKHLKSEDFFNTARFPTVTFISDSLVQQEGTNWLVKGDLQMHGVTKQIAFPATITNTEESYKAQAEFTINRFDWGIVYPGKPDDLIREKVLIRMELQTK